MLIPKQVVAVLIVSAMGNIACSRTGPASPGGRYLLMFTDRAEVIEFELKLKQKGNEWEGQWRTIRGTPPYTGDVRPSTGYVRAKPFPQAVMVQLLPTKGSSDVGWIVEIKGGLVGSGRWGHITYVGEQWQEGGATLQPRRM
jgi:hypothetical protein